MGEAVPTRLTVYTISELPKEVASRVVADMRYSVIDEDWDDSELEYWVEMLAGMGFQDPKIRCSGFCSQGDGASFTSVCVNVATFLKAIGAQQHYRLLTLSEYLGFGILRDHQSGDQSDQGQ